jgi:glycosyltransferase involved in cell wall biosynthesis
MKNVRPLLGPDVYLVGEIGGETKFRFLQSISSFVMPIRWEEPFGLVMIEALFCGTPVVAFRQGSAPEIVENGVTGFIVDTEEQMKDALHKSKTLDREKVREKAIQKFSSEIMTNKYISLYKNVLNTGNFFLS